MKSKFLFKLKNLTLALALFFISNQLIAQTSVGIFFQAVARDNYSNPAKYRKIYIQSSIIQSSAVGTKVLIEEHQANTDVTGMFSISIGNGTRVGGSATGLSGIDWSNGPFYLNLKVAITPLSGVNDWDYTKEWLDMGTTSFGAVPYAFYAANAAGVNQKLNITDTSKMLSVYAKAKALQNLETSVDTKLSISDTASMLIPYIRAALVLDSAYINAQLKSKVSLADSLIKYVTPNMLAANTFDTTTLSNRINSKASASDVANNFTLKLNIVDTSLLLQKSDTSSLSNRINLKANTSDVTSGLALKANATDVNTALNLKANSADVTSAINLKANTTDVNTALATKVDKVTGKDLSTNDYTNAEKTKLAAITGTNTGDQDLSALATNTALALKANTTDVTTSLGLKANTTDVNTSLATKVDKVTGKVLSTNDYSTAEKTKLAAITGTNTGDQDLSAFATNTAIALKANATDVNTALNLKANLASPTFTGTVSGVTKTMVGLGNVDNTSDANKPVSTVAQTALDLKANTTDVNTNLATKVDKVTGKELSTNDYTTAEKTKLAAITGTNTGDQVNITGNAATATLADNISATTNTTLTSLANLATVGTITSGTISLSTDIATTGNLKAGTVTYPNAHGTSGQVLSTTGSGTLSWTSISTPDLTNYVTTNTAQTITSAKTFSETTTFSKDAIVNGLTVGKGGGNKSNNTAIGAYALFSNTTGGGNTATGLEALALNETGSSNTAFGFGALSSNVAGSDNTAIGNGANVGSGNLTNTTAIGYNAVVNTSNTIQLGNTDVTNVKTSGAITAGGKIIAGASSAASSSAVLEASSTTQGFLPPRLTTTQRDAITTPVAGLTIWNITNTQLEVYDGSYWKNMVGLLVSPLNVGDTYGGGKVFYIFGPSDNGYIKGQTHGLIAAIEDQTTDAGVKWFPDKFYGATGTYIGLGLPNTLAIITSAIVTGNTNMSSFAAGLANSYRGGGNIDWFLPSKDELNLLYQAKDAIGGFATSGIPGYWSSTQKGGISFTNFTSFANGVTSARLQFFYTGGTPVQSSGTITDTGIENVRRVRAIRIF